MTLTVQQILRELKERLAQIYGARLRGLYSLNHGFRAHTFFKQFFQNRPRHFLCDLALCDEIHQSGEVIRRDRALLHGQTGFVVGLEEVLGERGTLQSDPSSPLRSLIRYPVFEVSSPSMYRWIMPEMRV